MRRRRRSVTKRASSRPSRLGNRDGRLDLPGRTQRACHPLDEHTVAGMVPSIDGGLRRGLGPATVSEQQLDELLARRSRRRGSGHEWLELVFEVEPHALHPRQPEESRPDSHAHPLSRAQERGHDLVALGKNEHTLEATRLIPGANVRPPERGIGDSPDAQDLASMLGDGLPPIEASVEGEEHGPRAVQGGQTDDRTVPECHCSLDGAPPENGTVEETHARDGEHTSNAQDEESEESLRGKPAQECEPRLEY